MPLYEYKCTICDSLKEISKPVDQAGMVELCDSCGSAMIKQYNSFGIQFKGSGFYSTDKK